jgi:hypothetical protein
VLFNKKVSYVFPFWHGSQNRASGEQLMFITVREFQQLKHHIMVQLVLDPILDICGLALLYMRWPIFLGREQLLFGNQKLFMELGLEPTA